MRKLVKLVAQHQIEAKQTRRPHRILVLKDYRRWRTKVIRCVEPFLDDAVLDWVKSNPPRYFVSDNLDWLDGAVFAAKRRCVKMRSVLADSLPREFDFMRGYHGCRAVSTKTYQDFGIRVSDPKWLQSEAERLFGDSERLREAFAELSNTSNNYESHNRGKSFFCWHEEDFIDDGCGHYLLYGSEYLLCVANRIGMPDTLRTTGKATIIECNVPLIYLSRDWTEEICGYLLCEVAQKYATGRSEFDGGCFFITRDLEPEYIVAFHHPTGILNPHNGCKRED